MSSISQTSPWRGCAANFSQPITEKDRHDAQYLVVTIHYFNCVVLHPTLPRIMYRTDRGERDILHRVFRWDLTPYEEVFEKGFRCRRKEDTTDEVYFSLEHYAQNDGNPVDSREPTTHAFLSTTLSPHWHPLIKPGTSIEIYRYEIYAPGGIHVAATLGQHYKYSAQDEVCFVAGIAPQYIRSAQKFSLTREGSRRTISCRANDELVINEHINPQAHPYRALPIQNPVVDYVKEDGSIENLNIKYHPAPEGDQKQSSSDDERFAAYWYAVDVAGVKSFINAAFRSHCVNEAYLFMKNEYVLVNYAPGKKEDEVKWGPVLICDGFSSLKGTTFGEYGIDCAFGSSSGTGHTYIFSGNFCALIQYKAGTTYDKIIEGPKTIAEMFPVLEGTVFETGIDAAFESTTEYEAYLFKDEMNARMNYEGSGSITIRPITKGFPSLKKTIFESGVDAAFASHRSNEAYLFKGDFYALINFAPATLDDYIIGGRVKKIKPNWPKLGEILPRKNRGLDVDGHDEADTEKNKDEPSADRKQDEF